MTQAVTGYSSFEKFPIANTIKFVFAYIFKADSTYTLTDQDGFDIAFRNVGDEAGKAIRGAIDAADTWAQAQLNPAPPAP